MRWTKFGLAALVGGTVLSATLAANAASSINNSLAGFTGDSTQAGTQADLATAGFSVYSTTGEVQQNNDNGTPDDPNDDFLEVVSNHTVTFDAGGAHFGSLIGGDGGRNYMRTVQEDFATSAFVAEVTFSTTSDDQQVFFGLGAGDTALFGTPDWSTQFSSASFWPETANDKFTRFRTANDVNNFGDSTVAGFDPGTHRFRMTFNPVNNQLQGEIDINYAGGPFVADAAGSNFPIVVSSLFGADGWPSEPSRIFFGGDDGTVFRDLTVNVVPEPATFVSLLLGAAMAAVLGRRRG
jgi:hypothetical protein